MVAIDTMGQRSPNQLTLLGDPQSSYDLPALQAWLYRMSAEGAFDIHAKAPRGVGDSGWGRQTISSSGCVLLPRLQKTFEASLYNTELFTGISQSAVLSEKISESQ